MPPQFLGAVIVPPGSGHNRSAVDLVDEHVGAVEEDEDVGMDRTGFCLLHTERDSHADMARC